MSEKKIAVILPTWNPDEPRFIVENCEHRIAEDREFMNNTCVFNQRLGFAYSVGEIVEVLNIMGDKLDELEKENEQLKSRIAFFEEQEDEFEQYTAQTIEDMIAYYRDDW